MIDNKTTYAYDALKRLTNVTEVAPYVNTILAHHLRWSPIH